MTSEQDRQATYQAWAERLKQRTSGVDDPDVGGPSTDDAGPGSYWSADSLFRDGQLHQERDAEAQRRKERTTELLATLGLPAGATLRDASDRYKQLARELHPDANLDSTTRTSREQLDQIVEINAAYDELKHLLKDP